jgi:hypothetical protein
MVDNAIKGNIKPMKIRKSAKGISAIELAITERLFTRTSSGTSCSKGRSDQRPDKVIPWLSRPETVRGKK